MTVEPLKADLYFNFVREKPKNSITQEALLDSERPFVIRRRCPRRNWSRVPNGSGPFRLCRGSGRMQQQQPAGGISEYSQESAIARLILTNMLNMLT
jgi:hypothetical protein